MAIQATAHDRVLEQLAEGLPLGPKISPSL